MEIPLFGLAAAISTFIPPVAGLLRFKSLSSDLKLFFWITVLNALWVLGQIILAYRNTNNLWMSHFYVLIEIALFIEVYRRWEKSEKIRMVLLLVTIGYAFVWLGAKIFIEHFLEPSLYMSPISRVILAVTSIYALYILARDSETPILQDPRFWIASTTLVYAAGAVMFYALQNIINAMQKEHIIRIYEVYWSFSLVIELAYTWVFICKNSHPNSGGQSALEQ